MNDSSRLRPRTSLAAVLVAVLAAAGCGPGQGVATSTLSTSDVAVATSSPAPTTSPTPAATPELPPALPLGDLEAGMTYSLPQGVLITVPGEDWFTIDDWFLGKDAIDQPLFPDYYDVTLLTSEVENLYTDPCAWNTSRRNPPVGPTVDDLATAFTEQEGWDGVAPIDIEIDGYAGKKVHLAIPDDVVIASCWEGNYGRWSPKGAPGDYAPYTYGNGQHDVLHIVDVDGRRWVIDANYQPGTSAANLAELEELVASIDFLP